MKIKLINNHQISDYQVIETLESQILSENYQKGRWTTEARTKQNLISLIAYKDQTPIAFKVGYELKPEIFYSWLGGVLPSHRGQGLARQLMEFQHQQLIEQGYKKVRTTTRNSLKNMLILNLKMGFDITGTQFEADEGRISIQLEKNLA